MSLDNVLVAMLGGAAEEKLNQMRQEEQLNLEERLLRRRAELADAPRLAQAQEAERVANIRATTMLSRLGDIAQSNPNAVRTIERYNAYKAQGVSDSAILEMPEFKAVSSALSNDTSAIVSRGAGTAIEQARAGADADRVIEEDDRRRIDYDERGRLTNFIRSAPPSMAREAVEAFESGGPALNDFFDRPEVQAIEKANEESINLSVDELFGLPAQRGFAEGTEAATSRATQRDAGLTDPQARGNSLFFDNETNKFVSVRNGSIGSEEMRSNPERYIPEGAMETFVDANNNRIFMPQGQGGETYRYNTETGATELISPSRRVSTRTPSASANPDDPDLAAINSLISPSTAARESDNVSFRNINSRAEQNNTVPRPVAAAAETLGYDTSAVRDLPSFHIVGGASGLISSAQRTLGAVPVVGDAISDIDALIGGEGNLGEEERESRKYFKALEEKIRENNIINQSNPSLREQNRVVEALGPSFGALTRDANSRADLESTKRILMDNLNMTASVLQGGNISGSLRSEYRRSLENTRETLSMVDTMLLNDEIHTTRIPIPGGPNVSIGELPKEDLDEVASDIARYIENNRSLPPGITRRHINLIRLQQNALSGR